MGIMVCIFRIFITLNSSLFIYIFKENYSIRVLLPKTKIFFIKKSYYLEANLEYCI